MHSPPWSQPRPGQELGLQWARSSASVGEASHLRSPEDPVRTKHRSGSRSVPAFVLTGELVSRLPASGTRIRPARALLVESPRENRHHFPRPALARSGLVSFPFLSARDFPNCVCLLSQERERKNPDSPFLSFGRGQSSPIFLKGNLFSEHSSSSSAVYSACIWPAASGRTFGWENKPISLAL